MMTCIFCLWRSVINRADFSMPTHALLDQSWWEGITGSKWQKKGALPMAAWMGNKHSQEHLSDLGYEWRPWSYTAAHQPEVSLPMYPGSPRADHEGVTCHALCGEKP